MASKGVYLTSKPGNYDTCSGLCTYSSMRNRGQIQWQAWARPVADRCRSTSLSRALVSRSSLPGASASRE